MTKSYGSATLSGIYLLRKATITSSPARRAALESPCINFNFVPLKNGPSRYEQKKSTDRMSVHVQAV